MQFVLAGFVGVALAAFIADRTGRAEDFFLPGLLLNAAYATAYLVSIAIRWPLLGVILGPMTGEGMSWRKDPERVRLYSRASWIWVGVFVAAARGPAAALSGGRRARARDRQDGDGPADLPGRDLALLPRPERRIGPPGEGSGARMLNKS